MNKNRGRAQALPLPCLPIILTEKSLVDIHDSSERILSRHFEYHTFSSIKELLKLCKTLLISNSNFLPIFIIRAHGEKSRIAIANRYIFIDRIIDEIDAYPYSSGWVFAGCSILDIPNEDLIRMSNEYQPMFIMGYSKNVYHFLASSFEKRLLYILKNSNSNNVIELLQNYIKSSRLSKHLKPVFVSYS